MQPQNSLIKFMVDQGFSLFVISWKNPDASMEDTNFDDYLELGPLAALDVVTEITGSPTVNPIGYCIGGTLLSMPIDLEQIRQDIYAVGTEQDYIVPWRSAWRITQLASGKSRFVVGGSGHIAGVINPPTRGRGYWSNPKPAASANAWMAGATRSTAHPPLTPAPGTRERCSS